MRILIQTQYYWPEPTKLVTSLAADLVAAGHEVRVVTAKPNYPFGLLYDSYGFWPLVQHERGPASESIFRMPTYPYHGGSPLRRGLNYLVFVLGTVFMAGRHRSWADVAYVYGSPATAGLSLTIARRARRTPYVVHVQDLWPESVARSALAERAGWLGRGFGRCAAWVADRVYSRAASLVAISAPMEELLIGRGYPNIRTVLNWATEPVPVTEPRTARQEAIRTFMYAGNVGVEQGIDEIVLAWGRAEAAGMSGAELVIVGVGSGIDKAKAAAADRPSTAIRFTGRVDDRVMNTMYESSDIQVIALRRAPHLEVAIPGKTQQVLARGLPVMAVAAGALPAVVAEGDLGWCVDPDDRQGVADLFSRLAVIDKEDLAATAARCRQFYDANLTRTAGTSALADTLRSIT